MEKKQKKLDEKITEDIDSKDNNNRNEKSGSNLSDNTPHDYSIVKSGAVLILCFIIVVSIHLKD